MKFPNKVNSYKSSVFPLLPMVLKLLSVRDYTVDSLYEKLKTNMTISEYIDALDCLYAMGQLTLNKEVLHYVKRNPM